MIRFPLFQQFESSLTHAVLTREIDIDQYQKTAVSFKEQLHRKESWIVDKNNMNRKAEGDILITAEPGIPLVIRIADCASVLLYDPKKKIIANIHAGWRGLAHKTIPEAVELVQEHFNSNPRDIFAGISPMLGPCCSRFSDPRRELPEFLHDYIDKENIVNLWAVAEDQLRESGVPKKQIENLRLCTFCNPKDFYSYRRDQSDERFGTVIMLK